MSDSTLFELISFTEICGRYEAKQELQKTLHPSDPRQDNMFRYDDELGYLDLYWGGYEYSIPLSDIADRNLFLSVLSHVLNKGWEQATCKRVSRLIQAHSSRMGWNLFRSEPKALEIPTSRETADAEERGKLTPSLRYSVLKRDNFRCRACGFGVESGAHLHIDHIVPVSKFGRTEFSNLQALCSACNLGKGAKL